MENEKILPVEEMLAYEEFTDRVEILRELDTWVKKIQRMTAPSTAIIAPRRMGKTVLLDRLVNTVFFKPEYKVAPFYFRVKREDTTLRNFLLEYATTFFRQYIAYCLQDPVLYRDDKIELEQLLECPSDHSSINLAAISQVAINLAKEFIEGFLRRYHNRRYDDTRNQWDGFIRAPEQLGSLSGIRVAVIIDEFQDMNFYIHDIHKQDIDRIKEKRLTHPELSGIKLTSTYDRQAQSRKAPMLVSGSAVTLIFRTVMGGPLGGRFGFKYLKPLSIPDGAVLLRTLLPLYSDKSEITPENAMYASTQTGGHPYYLYCLSISDYEAKSFDSRDAIDGLIHYEITQGKIYGFWQTHFEDNRKTINMDADDQTYDQIGRKIIYYFTKYNNQPVEIKEIAEKLNIPKKIVEKKIEQLYQADLVYKTKARFYTFNDICLMRYIKFVYEQDIEDVDEIDLSQRNLFNTLRGTH